MSLRIKLAVAMVALAAAATVAVGWISYVSTERRLRDEVDASLVTAAQRVLVLAGTLSPPPAPARDRNGDGQPDAQLRNFTQVLVQLLDGNGQILRSQNGVLPVERRDIDVAAGSSRRQAVRHDVTIDGGTHRMLTVAMQGGGAVQVARSLAETERVLDDIRNATLLIVVVAGVVAGLAGVFIAQQVTRRLVRLTDAATTVARSGDLDLDLDLDVPVDGSDETGRLGRAFNEMLSSLAHSKRSQQQLVQDAGHELRTPLTSLRTNVSVMQRYDELSPESRQRLLADVESETRELSALVNELVELANHRRDTEDPSPVALGELAERVADRFRRRSGRSILVQADDSVVVARPAALERAVSNLVENAMKFSDGEVQLGVVHGRVAVSDRGPGLADADLSKVFDRFFRSDAARALPGSGLGLSIVRQMADQHAGSVFALNRKGGGSTIGFQLPLR